MCYRIGQGYDVHPLAAGRSFYLGGILIPHSKGAVGHSDADVLIHAIGDALLGAIAIGDLGTHFPDNDPQYKGIDSKVLLQKIVELLQENHYQIVNIDSTVTLQRPKIALFILEMRKVLSQTMHINMAQLSIKATTTEHLGFEGREEGLSATAIVLVKKT
ncbi:2-C-methyl-D-erythritol 2,4-cyclodiphosphate synthase [Bacteroidia bacterium]|nr:2-C-methyl-D-erythritol 2,4-cyclodiphosphate synthase [Bacteroidia bacterium]